MQCALRLCRNKTKSLHVLGRMMSTNSDQQPIKAAITTDSRPTDTSSSTSGSSRPTCMPTVQHLCRDGDNTVASRRSNGNNPGVTFLPGFMSNMTGTKAVALERFCNKADLAYIRFDYQGCGESKGSLKPGVNAFDVWRTDALAVLDQLTSGPQVFNGRSLLGPAWVGR